MMRSTHAPRVHPIHALLGLAASMLVLCLLGAAPAAAELAIFTDGRIIKVEDAVLEGDRIALTLPGGGHLVVSALRIDRVVADEVMVPVHTPPTEPDCSVRWVEDSLPPGTPFADEIRAAAEDADIHPRLLTALVRAESNFDPVAMSRAGAAGLTQLMPAAAADQGVSDLFDPVQNLAGGAHHLRALLDRFPSLSLALAAYNAGATTVIRYDGIPPYRETQEYVRRVLSLFCPHPA